MRIALAFCTLTALVAIFALRGSGRRGNIERALSVAPHPIVCDTVAKHVGDLVDVAAPMRVVSDVLRQPADLAGLQDKEELLPASLEDNSSVPDAGSFTVVVFTGPKMGFAAHRATRHSGTAPQQWRGLPSRMSRYNSTST